MWNFCDNHEFIAFLLFSECIFAFSVGFVMIAVSYINRHSENNCCEQEEENDDFSENEDEQ